MQVWNLHKWILSNAFVLFCLLGLGQVRQMVQEEGEEHEGPRLTHIRIPAAYSSGITFFALRQSELGGELLSAPELPVLWPDYHAFLLWPLRWNLIMWHWLIGNWPITQINTHKPILVPLSPWVVWGVTQAAARITSFIWLFRNCIHHFTVAGNWLSVAAAYLSRDAPQKDRFYLSDFLGK